MTAPGSFDAASPPQVVVGRPHRRPPIVLGLVIAVAVAALTAGAVITQHPPTPVATPDDPAAADRSPSSGVLRTRAVPWKHTVGAHHVIASRSHRLVAVAPDAPTATRLEHILQEARAAVTAATGSAPLLVAYLPASQADFRSALRAGSGSGSYTDVAAITTTLDGSHSPSATQMVLLNPRVTRSLTPTALRVVVTHEATHVATDAIDTDGPLWLEEGFADYVALAHVDVPTTKVAAEAIHRLQRVGLPAGWPAAEAFDGSPRASRVAYELAWAGVRQIVADVGERPFLRFYRAVVGGIPLGDAARTVLGTTTHHLVTRYEQALADLAHGR